MRINKGEAEKWLDWIAKAEVARMIEVQIALLGLLVDSLEREGIPPGVRLIYAADGKPPVLTVSVPGKSPQSLEIQLLHPDFCTRVAEKLGTTIPTGISIPVTDLNKPCDWRNSAHFAKGIVQDLKLKPGYIAYQDLVRVFNPSSYAFIMRAYAALYPGGRPEPEG